MPSSAAGARYGKRAKTVIASGSGPEPEAWSPKPGLRYRLLLLVRIIGVPQNADRPLETCGQWASLVRVVRAVGNPHKFHVHARAGPPTIQNDAVEQPSTVACTASDERAERVLASVDLIYRLERINWYGDGWHVEGTGGAQSVIKNLPDKSAYADPPPTMPAIRDRLGAGWSLAFGCAAPVIHFVNVTTTPRSSSRSLSALSARAGERCSRNTIASAIQTLPRRL